MSAVRTWFPLESNPKVMNAYMNRLGLNTDKYSFVDVFSTEEWALDMIPRPVHAVLMLFPITAESEKFAAQENARIAAEGQVVSPQVRFIKQTIGNACGTIALLHAASNMAVEDAVKPGSYLATFGESSKDKSPEAVAALLEADDALEECHEAAAEEGDSAQITAEEDVDLHFICFTQVDNHLYELDGRKAFPINHGPSADDTLLEDASRAISEFMKRQPEDLRFTIVALCEAAAENDEDDEEVTRESQSNQVD